MGPYSVAEASKNLTPRETGGSIIDLRVMYGGTGVAMPQWVRKVQGLSEQLKGQAV